MVRAIWNGVVLATSEHTELLEGQHYFPPGTVDAAHLVRSSTMQNCLWKGVSQHFHIEVNGQVNPDAAWCFPEPKPEARDLRNYIAFNDTVSIEIVAINDLCVAGH